MTEIMKHIKGNEAIFEIPKEYSGKILHVTIGDENFIPTEEEMSKLSRLVLDAVDDPNGAVLVTHHTVKIKVLQI